MKATLEDIVAKSKDIHRWIVSHLDGLEVKRIQTKLVSTACYDMVIEYQVAVTTLVEGKVNGAAYSMIRPIFETTVRGLWFQYRATEDDVKQFLANDKLEKYQSELIGEIESIPGFEDGVLSGVRNASWNAMCDYVHGGKRQLARRISDGDFFPNYPDEEVIEVLKFANMMALIAFQQISLIGGNEEAAMNALSMLEEIPS